MRAAHDDTAKAACSSASRSASARPSSPSTAPGRSSRSNNRSAWKNRCTQSWNAVPSSACGSGRTGSATLQPAQRALGIAADVHQRAHRQLRRAAPPAGRCERRSRSASSASTSAAHPSTSASPRRVPGAPPAMAATDELGAAVDAGAARHPPGRRATMRSITLSRNGFDSPSAGAGAQCSTTPHGVARGRGPVDHVLDLEQEVRRSARLGLGGTPVMTRQQQRVLGAGERDVQQAALLVDPALIERLRVLGRSCRTSAFRSFTSDVSSTGTPCSDTVGPVAAQQRRQVAGVGQPGARATPSTGTPGRSGAAPRRPATPAPWRRAR